MFGHALCPLLRSDPLYVKKQPLALGSELSGTCGAEQMLRFHLGPQWGESEQVQQDEKDLHAPHRLLAWPSPPQGGTPDSACCVSHL